MRVVIIGGGVVGMCCAYYLRQLGAAPVIIERDRVGRGTSWANAGWISPTETAPLAAPGMLSLAVRSLLSDGGPMYADYTRIIKRAPWLLSFARYCNQAAYDSGIRALAKLNASTLGLYRALARDGVEYEMRWGILHAFQSEGAAEEAHALLGSKGSAGNVRPELVTSQALRELEPALSSSVVAALFLQEPFLVSETLVHGLTKALRDQDVEMREGVEALGFRTARSRVLSLITDDGEVFGDQFLIANGAWSSILAKQLGSRLPIEPGKGYSFSIIPGTLPNHAIHFDGPKIVSTPLHGSIRLAGIMELAGYDTSFRSERANVMQVAAETFLGPVSLGSKETFWTGLRPLTPDGMPILDRLGTCENAFVATGHGMNGMVLGPASGKWMSQLMIGGSTPQAIAPFTLDRFGGSLSRKPHTSVTSDLGVYGRSDEK